MPEREFDQWVTRLIRENAPVFTRTVQSVAGMASSDNCSLSELAWSILEDPALTTLVLKLANSIYYNPCSKRISTVTRALMRLGADTVKEMCLAIALIEIVLSSLHKEKVAVEVSRAFHSAVQARRIAIRRNLPGPEEIFIAALLTRIGNIVFWCFAGEAGERLQNAMSNAEREDMAEMEVLGFKLERLTLRLSQEWKLSDLLESALLDKKGTNPRVRSIKLGCAVAQASEHGWDSSEIKGIIKEAADFLQITENDTANTLHESARAAAEITESYGVGMCSRLVPLPAEAAPLLSVQAVQTQHEYPKPDPHIQLCSLRDLSTLLTFRDGDVNMALSIVLEGIYRGIGMDRVIFAVLTPDRRQLLGKHGLGCIDEKWVANLKIVLDSGTLNLFDHMLRKGKPIWVTEKPDESIKYLLTKELFHLTGGGPFFAAPIAVKTKMIGIIYADRNQSGRSLDEESFESFAFFEQQANISLGILSGN